MAEKNNSNKMITILLVIVICIAAIAVLYVNLPTDDKDDADDSEDQGSNDEGDDGTDDDTDTSTTVLTLIYGAQQINYTMDQIKEMNNYTGEGAKIKKTLSITGPYNYTGLKMTLLLSEFGQLPENYSITTVSTDGYTVPYTQDQIQGTVELLNETRGSQGNVSLTMLLAYLEEGQEITDPEYWPFMIVFVDDYYTDSSLWAKAVRTIEIIEE